MMRRDTTYVYGDEDPGAALPEGDTDESGRVIINGAVMSFRSYRRLGD
jgi:hypothetical protein